MISRRRAAQILLYLSAVLILVGGLYDLLTPSAPPHHLAFLGVSAQELDPRTASLLPALLRALGGALIGVGVGSLILINRGVCQGHRWATVALVLMVGLTEGVNAGQMHSVGSPYWAPLTFICLMTIGAALAHVPTNIFPTTSQTSPMNLSDAQPR